MAGSCCVAKLQSQDCAVSKAVQANMLLCPGSCEFEFKDCNEI